jgi:predicted TIM-barrel fold metal-dependent hydrolase
MAATTTKKKHRIIAIEEHYMDVELAKHNAGMAGMRSSDIGRKLADMTNERVKEMDEGGIDVQVLSQSGSGTQNMDPKTAAELAPGVNDRLYETVRMHPDRFQAFAMLPTPDPKAAANELERTVTKYGFKGAMIHGLTHGEFIDDAKYWPIFERAAALDVPIYLHPATPHPKVIETYYKEYVQKYPGIITAPLGYTMETMTQGVRMVLSGVFDKYPNLKIILGHMGEGIPFLLWRINHTLHVTGNTGFNFRDVFCEHFWITTSGFFSDPALLCSMMEMSADRIIFSIDWPWANNKEGRDWLDSMSISASDKAKIFGGNAEKLLRMERNA